MKKKLYLMTVFTVLAITLFSFFGSITNKMFEIYNINYETKYQYTHYYPGDPTGSGNCTGSGKCVSDFTVGSDGRYYYNYNGKDYLVVAAATTYCRDKANHCGVNVAKHGLATSIKYYNYYDTLSLPINGQMVDAIVLDSCGACMWGRQDQRGTELIDIFISNGSPAQSVEPGETEENEETGVNFNDHITSYDGQIDEGWLYLRSKAYEDAENKYYYGPDVLDDAIDEIFYRARVTYTANMQYGRKNYDTIAEMLIETIPQDVMELMENYWYTFDINNYLGNTLFGQCVWYAKHRALEIIDNSSLDDATKQVLIESIKKTSGNGQDWYANPDGSLFKKSSNVNEPKPGAIISWSHGQYGHVAIVESVYEKDGQTMLTISEGSRIKHDTDGDGVKDGWIASSTLEHALSQTKIETSEVPLSQIQNRWGYSFNGYVYLLDEG